ncbi:helix-turn-helix domain-containing protein [Limimaricola cinnabarinus]|uniref:Uncharacterized protein n=1 Tax=Limimaricola cinnabarinus LL-001 TaxID=1337093 RepID=U3AIV1_9RHOB|nr:helix-turn-helix domain-containing protein [Limimaricola cinnabarinus]GAD57609.1 hypothetical protein MBELCI_3661 [Limimaricola cinnabarinus LL-001]
MSDDSPRYQFYQADFIPPPLDKRIATVEIWPTANHADGEFEIRMNASFGVDIVALRTGSGDVEVEIEIRQAEVVLKEHGCLLQHGHHYYEYFSPRPIEKRYIEEANTEREGSLGQDGNLLPRISVRGVKKGLKSAAWDDSDIGFRHPELRTVIVGDWRKGSALSGTFPRTYSGWLASRSNGSEASGVLAKLNVRKNWIEIRRVEVGDAKTAIGRAIQSVRSLSPKRSAPKMELFSDLVRELIYLQLQSSDQKDLATLAAAGLVVAERGAFRPIAAQASKCRLEAPGHVLLRMLNAPDGAERATYDALISEVHALQVSGGSDFFPLVPYARVLDVYLRLTSKFEIGAGAIDAAKVLEYCDKKSFLLLKGLGLIREEKGGVQVFNHFPQMSTIMSFQAIVRRQKTIAFVDDLLRNDPLVSAYDVGRELNDKFSKGWKESSFQRYGHQILSWVRFEGTEADARGRRIRMTEERVKLLTKYVAEGVPIDEIAAHLDVSRATLYSWRRSEKNTVISKYGGWKLVQSNREED